MCATSLIEQTERRLAVNFFTYATRAPIRRHESDLPPGSME
jgi:hypothetical protein